MKSASIVIAGTVAAAGLTVLRQLLDGEISMKPVIGGFITGTFLLLLAFFSVEISVALALMILTASVLKNAGPILAKVQP